MGAWGAGSFENDDALDWLGEFAASPAEPALVATLTRAAKPDGYLGADIACQAIAAADVVAALRGHASSDESIAGAIEAIRKANLPAAEATRKLALVAIDRIESDSELKDLWMESDAEEWSASLTDLRSRLA